MIPVNQFILGSSDPLLYPSEKMTNSIDEQIAFLQSQKQAINEAYRRNAIPNANNGTTQNQQVPTQGIWDAIDAEIAPLTQEQQNMLLNNQDYVNNYNALQSMVQAEVLNLVRGKIEASEDGKHLLEEQLKLVKLLKSKIVEVTNKEMELFKAFKEASNIMVEIGNVKEVIKDYIIKQLVSMGESSPAIRLLIPLAKRAITNNINSFDKFLKPIADKDGMIDIEGIFDEEMEVINNIDNFNFDIPFIGGGNISKGIISLEVPYVNKIVALNQTDLEVLKESLISLKTK